LPLTNVQTNDAGAYSVIVSNGAGTATSLFATLAITTNAPNFDLIGFATIAGGTTGGAGGPTNTVTTGAEFRSWCLSNFPMVIQVQGSLNLGSSTVYIRSDKTILGLGTNATLLGNIKMAEVSNVVVRNVFISNPTGIGDNDDITIQDARHIWIDHCTLSDSIDGLCDIVDASDYVTFSWNKLVYTSDTGHNLSCLVGHDDNNAARDSGKLHVTYHHNWWSALCIERMPRVRFGEVHAYNSYFNPSPDGSTITNHYCLRAAIGAQLLIENNNFENAANPWERFVTTGSNGLARATNNITNNCIFVDAWTEGATVIPGTNDVFAPPYSYVMEPPADIPSTVTNNAGAGKGPFAP
jgi:pectate lyase